MNSAREQRMYDHVRDPVPASAVLRQEGVWAGNEDRTQHLLIQPRLGFCACYYFIQYETTFNFLDYLLLLFLWYVEAAQSYIKLVANYYGRGNYFDAQHNSLSIFVLLFAICVAFCSWI